MSKMTPVLLDQDCVARIDAQIAAGHFASAADAVREALALLEARDRDLADLRAEIKKGEESGWIEVDDIDAYFADLLAKAGA